MVREGITGQNEVGLIVCKTQPDVFWAFSLARNASSEVTLKWICAFDIIFCVDCPKNEEYVVVLYPEQC